MKRWIFFLTNKRLKETPFHNVAGLGCMMEFAEFDRTRPHKFRESSHLYSVREYISIQTNSMKFGMRAQYLYFTNFSFALSFHWELSCVLGKHSRTAAEFTFAFREIAKNVNHRASNFFCTLFKHYRIPTQYQRTAIAIRRTAPERRDTFHTLTALIIPLNLLSSFQLVSPQGDFINF